MELAISPRFWGIHVANKLLSSLSKAEVSGLLSAKAQLSKRFLRVDVTAQAASARGLGARALRGAADLAPRHNVVGIGVDEKYVSGVPTGVPVVKFLVRSKVPRSALSKGELLPAKVDGFETDVEETGLILPQAKKKRSAATAAATTTMPNPRTRVRPAQPGSSVGFQEPAQAFVMAGTFGRLVKHPQGKKYVLSNNHVLAFESGVQADGQRRSGLPAGASIFQPGLLDGGNADGDKIAELTRWINLRADRTDNAVDGAIALVTPQSAAT